MSEPFLAEIRIWALNFAPRGWAFCDGSLLPISENTALFSLVGTTYGGDSRTTFGLPDLRGRAPMHPGSGPGLTPRRLGDDGGSENHFLTSAQIPSHSHSLVGAGDQANLKHPGSNRSVGISRFGSAYQTDSSSNLVEMHSDGMTRLGGNQTHNNMQPFQTVNFCIALVGLYPSRS
jgi:microcystin-dependent protein